MNAKFRDRIRVIGAALGYTFAAIWIFVGGFFFYTRFSYLIYDENRERIDHALEMAGQWLANIF